MTLFIILVGVLIFVAGLIFIVKEELIFGFLESNRKELWIHVVAVLVRVVLGAALVAQAEVSSFPTIITILGWLTLIAALILFAMGRDNFQTFMKWVLDQLKPYARIGGGISAAFGAFLIYAFV